MVDRREVDNGQTEHRVLDLGLGLLCQNRLQQLQGSRIVSVVEGDYGEVVNKEHPPDDGLCRGHQDVLLYYFLEEGSHALKVLLIILQDLLREGDVPDPLVEHLERLFNVLVGYRGREFGLGG